DLESPLRDLLAARFVLEQDGILESTALGRAANDLMVRVASAAALENYLASRLQRTSDPKVLEQELLIAACHLPVEFDELPNRRADGTLSEPLGSADTRLR